MKKSTVALAMLLLGTSGCAPESPTAMNRSTLLQSGSAGGCYVQLTMTPWSIPGQLEIPLTFKLSLKPEPGAPGHYMVVPAHTAENTKAPHGTWRVAPGDSLIVGFTEYTDGVTLPLERIGSGRWEGTATAWTSVRYASPPMAHARLEVGNGPCN